METQVVVDAVKTTVELITSKMDQLITAVGGGVKTYYPYVVRQQLVEGIIGITGTIIVVLCVIVGCMWASKEDWSAQDNKSSVRQGICAVLTITSFFICIGAVINTCINFIPQLCNPHYYAVKEIVEIGKDLIK